MISSLLKHYIIPMFICLSLAGCLTKTSQSLSNTMDNILSGEPLLSSEKQPDHTNEAKTTEIVQEINASENQIAAITTPNVETNTTQSANNPPTDFSRWMGQELIHLIANLGQPDFQRQEGNITFIQYRREQCILDFYIQKRGDKNIIQEWDIRQRHHQTNQVHCSIS